MDKNVPQWKMLWLLARNGDRLKWELVKPLVKPYSYTNFWLIHTKRRNSGKSAEPGFRMSHLFFFPDLRPQRIIDLNQEIIFPVWYETSDGDGFVCLFLLETTKKSWIWSRIFALCAWVDGTYCTNTNLCCIVYTYAFYNKQRLYTFDKIAFPLNWIKKYVLAKLNLHES